MDLLNLVGLAFGNFLGMMMIEHMEKRWIMPPQEDVQVVQDLAKQINVSEAIAYLLVRRGVKTFEEAKSFFRPQLSDLHDPFLMRDMDLAVNRILAALELGERIQIYGDYDVDGTTSVALMYDYLKELFADRISYYIPDRYSEGYGISNQGIDVAKADGCKLIIALDCGIRSVDKVAYASELGIDFIICDHHLPGDVLPQAAAVLDPKRSDCAYPFKELSACGVGFKLVQALESKLQTGKDIFLLLDLVSTSIAADIVPIVDENRVLAFYGMKQINLEPRLGLKSLLDAAKKKGSDSSSKQEVQISDLVFNVAPRINAAGRVDHGKKAVQLLVTTEKEDVQEILDHINSQNTIRRDLDRQMTSEALAIIESSPTMQARSSNVLYKENWHKGVVGIIASRVIENYYKPTIILTESNGKATGSARSVKGFDVYLAIASCADLLDQFGGHMYAAGLTLPIENVPEFSRRFEDYVSTNITESQRTPVVEIDLELDIDELTPSFYQLLKQFAPFGPGNMSPVLLTKGLIDDGSSRIVGGTHLKMKLGKRGKAYFDAIAFGLASFEKPISQGIPVDVCYSLEENRWGGKVSIQWMVKDIKF